jgi:hypothetical protein
MKRLQPVRESSPKVDYIDEIERYGFSVIQDTVNEETTRSGLIGLMLRFYGSSERIRDSFDVTCVRQ